MRNLYRCLFLLSAIVLAGGMWSCSDDNDEPGSNGGEPVLGVEAPASDAVFATSATFKLSTKGAESYVYKVAEGANAAEPDPIVAYAEAQENGTIVTVDGDTDEALVAGLEGNKTYTVFFIFKVGNEYKIYSQKINTPEYSQIVTVIKTDMFSMTIHVEVPEDVYYSLGFISVENYIGYKEQYGKTDADYVVANPYGGMRDPRYKGPQNITIANGANAYTGALNEKDYKDDIFPYSVHPGTGYVIFVGQCTESGTSEGFVNYIDDGGGDDDWGALKSKLPNVKEYTEEKPVSETMEFTGLYAKTVLFSQEPKLGSGNVMVNIDRITEKSVVVSFTPTDDILQYVVMMLSDEEREAWIESVGGIDGWQASVLNYGDVVDGAQQGAFSLAPGVSYTLSVLGIYAEDGTVQTFQEINGIKTIVSDKPAAELKVTPLTLENPYQIGFNIKAPNGDCAAFKYVLNYTKEWYPMLNQLEGAELEDRIGLVIGSFGQGINDAEVLSKINGSEGYDMFFSSMDDTESWLILESYNVDEKSKLFYDGADYRTSSAPLKAEAPVNSELFGKLQGTWKATMTGAYEDVGTVEMPVTIAAGPEKIATLPEDVKAALVKYYVEVMHYTEENANKAVLKYFEEFQERTDYYTQKYKNMNCLVATGFSYSSGAPLATPWDLLQSTDYSSYNTDELFRDYGPKLFLQIGKDEDGKDMVTVITTRYAEDGYSYYRYVDPVADWYNTMQLYAYSSETANNFYVADFPVEISDDMNTITIKAVEQDGKTYAPGFATELSGGAPSWDYPVNTAGIILTRITDNTAVQKAATSRSISNVTPKVNARSGNHFRRTCAPYDYSLLKTVKMKVFSMDSMKKNLKK